MATIRCLIPLSLKRRDTLHQLQTQHSSALTIIISKRRPNRRLTLDALLFLLKSRYNTNLHATVRRMVIRQTNTLYREGLGINLMKSVTNGLNHLRNPTQFMLMDSCLRKVSECLFFMYYGTQIEEFEVSSLIDVMKSTSDILVDTVTPGIVEEWKTSAYSILAVLQMTHIAALDQFNTLLLRANDDINTSEDGINTLKLPRESKGGLDVVWRSKGAKGLACLANAVLQQPAVDNNEAPASDVIWYLKEASENRAYSYIRLCVLPLLQCSYLGDDEHFYISVLCELLRKIAHIFHIYELARHPDKSQYLRSHDLALARSGTDRSRLIRADCLDDVMHLFAVVCSVRPSYADAFRDVDAAGASALHPFVVTSIEASDRQQCLALPSMRLLAGVASGLNGSSSSASYHFLKSGRHARLKWDHFFHCIEGFANKLGPVQPVNPLGMIAPSGSSIVSVRSAPLNPKDEEGLLAIIELIGACVQDSNIASNMYHKYDPVKKLFSLLACPIPISLKGSVFRTLAAFVKSSSTIAAEVWDLIELYRLLPSKGTTGVQQGLRFELEATESRAGVYSSTEGFLQLLDALLCTHETPDSLGMGYRRPGLTVYLEFVIDDVLLRAHERFYAPEGTHRGMTQRWRLTARALKVLVSIMQHYAINRLPLGPLSSLPFAVRDDQLLQGIAADFREEIVSYKIDDLPEQRCSRPKTMGFSLMALMLGRCRLLERVLSLLGECSLAALDAESALQGGETAKTSVEIFATMQDPKRIPAMTGGFNASSNEEERDLELDLSLMGFNEESFACDGSYWMEKTVSNCIGLLYECALREGRFLELILSAPPLTLLRSEDGRTAALPVMVQGGLVEALSSSLALGTIAHFLRLPAQRWHSIPSVPVMATRLLEHVSISQSSDRFMWAMRSSPEEEGYLLTGCVRAIIEGDETETSAVFKENFPLGADRYPDVFSLSSSTSGRAPDIKEMLKIAMTDNGGTLETARGALLRLMLRALVLTPDRLCLTHQLLGLRQAIEDGSNGSNLAALSQLQRPTLGYMPANCLQAILILISPSDPAYIDSTPSFIQREPELACICYEIIYRLCAAPLSSAVALGYLRLYDVQFLRTQMIELLHLAGLSDSNLRPSDEQIAESSSHRSVPLL
jgi:Nuclear pore complex scaffold, nucleoporins 186/192/205